MSAEKFGNWLRSTREKAQLTQDQLAEKIGMKKAYVSKLENATDEPNPTLETLDAIAKALNVDLAKVISERGYSVLNKTFHPELKESEQLLLWMFNDLPTECQLDVMASVSGIHQRRSMSARIIDRHEARATARAEIETKTHGADLPPLSRGEQVMSKVEIGAEPKLEDFHNPADYYAETGKTPPARQKSPARAAKSEQGNQKRKRKRAA